MKGDLFNVAKREKKAKDPNKRISTRLQRILYLKEA